MKEISKEEWEILQEENRHSELTSLLQQIANNINKEDDGQLVVAINQQAESINRFVNTIKGIPAPIVDTTPVANSIDVMAARIIDSLTKVELLLIEHCRTKEWEFTVYRDKMKYIQSITAKEII